MFVCETLFSSIKYTTLSESFSLVFTSNNSLCNYSKILEEKANRSLETSFVSMDYYLVRISISSTWIHISTKVFGISNRIYWQIIYLRNPKFKICFKIFLLVIILLHFFFSTFFFFFEIYLIPRFALPTDRDFTIWIFFFF